MQVIFRRPPAASILVLPYQSRPYQIALDSARPHAPLVIGLQPASPLNLYSKAEATEDPVFQMQRSALDAGSVKQLTT